MAEPIGRYNPLKARPIEESQDTGPVLERRIGRYNPLKTRPVEANTGPVLQKRGGWDLICGADHTYQCKDETWVCSDNGDPHPTTWYDSEGICATTCTCDWIIIHVIERSESNVEASDWKRSENVKQHT
ncbi:uncharacterized protein AB675_7545 [Cyphellophora attinorum]|uniref:Uncharacterized protein n=1 Tax=Cyphellophora attinorum TaxID=1664694 RepID=A0A0N1HR16_9EURO|nr:uncharacterized protein AB675_7545 [Phialophora attinorum]KPI40572.1 hypothetical protein AB675_7545 [Phialophora attinorum]